MYAMRWKATRMGISIMNWKSASVPSDKSSVSFTMVMKFVAHKAMYMHVNMICSSTARKYHRGCLRKKMDLNSAVSSSSISRWCMQPSQPPALGSPSVLARSSAAEWRGDTDASALAGVMVSLCFKGSWCTLSSVTRLALPPALLTLELRWRLSCACASPDLVLSLSSMLRLRPNTPSTLLRRSSLTEGEQHSENLTRMNTMESM
mmetsp:Transcript_36246/g.62526  ORF Transcript_36246/g.62526 Transcript_36246/m.62526 type:complete len:205 (-) Transcript_36246:1194-1808(-)